ncbi:MAG: ABC transporter ATP-binding protein [Paracoccaceae bacterium]
MVQPLLSIRNLHLTMTSFDGEAYVLNGIDLDVRRGEIWGLVGESGCGKSLTGLSVSRLVPEPPARYGEGEILFEGRDILKLPMREVQALRGKHIGMIFQDPTTNLNPAYRIGVQLVDVALAAASHDASVLDCPAGAGRRERRRAARRLAGEMLDRVGIPNAAERLDNYPHEFSGGMRQRVLIAMALIGRPDLLIADEPTTALDVSVQAQILKLLKGTVSDHDIGVILITHNLGVVAETCSHVAVMYAGNIVESGPVAEVIESAAHPYTKALMAAVPTKESKRGSLKGLGGTVPNLIAPPPGCRFAPRCPLAIDACRQALPPAINVRQDHQAACIRLTEAQVLADV